MSATPFSASADTAGEARATFIAPHQFAPACRTAPTQAVRASEAELDAHIVDLGRLMAIAHADGERGDAIRWQAAMYAAIRSRSQRHQAAMHARIDDACYFSSDAAHQATGGAA